ncbi:cytochrome c3 family protein [Sulfuricurvum sp.]|uniref:cytochrome c3 family protein n=1 Tax=Sulfuricurvum sp. TaxID=2025608 RepID=UPI00261D939C|nr:cytochrome c3 family protein [Sulfuricurvum sp.]MDD2780049.1 cytochrome c3 family protein [Sulfuricurvum sp.]
MRKRMRTTAIALAAVAGLMFAVLASAESDPAKGAPTADERPVFEPHLKSGKTVVHPPYEMAKADKDCSFCHTEKDAKSGALKMDMPDLCNQCHEGKDTKKYIHGPVGAGACTACHDPHESENVKLLRFSSINQLCTSCHADKGHFLKSTKNIHPPVQDQCTNCHDPHTENFKFQLKADGKKDLCLMCHVDKKEHIATVTHKHGAMDRPKQCQECHDPHGNGAPKMLKKDTTKDLCLSCHNDKMAAEGSKLTNMDKHLKDNPDHHGPILWGDCAACHNPHGSDNLRMLKKPFPETFYAKFDEKSYICFECHEPSKIQNEMTTTATNFRNGEKNMHFVHVNKDKGRSCRACHDFHGTKEYPHHLRTKTSFGAINFPIRYIETPAGGSCAPACHARRGYDREKPIENLK